MSESSAAASKAQASAFPDGTTDYVPLRAGGKYDLKKVHISETPITWGNWYKHVNWLNTTFIVFIPLLGFVSAYWVPLKLATAIFSVIYYFNTGLGITAGKLTLISLSSNSLTYSYKATTVSGLTPHTRPLSPSESSLPLSVLAPSKAPSAGGQEATALTTDTPTPKRTPTPSARVSCTPTSAGWS